MGGGARGRQLPPTEINPVSSKHYVGNITPFTVVVRDPGLQKLAFCQWSLRWVRHNVDECNAVEADHLLEIDISRVITVYVVNRKAVICSVRVRFEDIAPVRRRRLGGRDVQEDRLGARFEDRVRLDENVRGYKVRQ